MTLLIAVLHCESRVYVDKLHFICTNVFILFQSFSHALSLQCFTLEYPVFIMRVAMFLTHWYIIMNPKAATYMFNFKSMVSTVV